jgi:hypothetical protein
VITHAQLVQKDSMQGSSPIGLLIATRDKWSTKQQKTLLVYRYKHAVVTHLTIFRTLYCVNVRQKVEFGIVFIFFNFQSLYKVYYSPNKCYNELFPCYVVKKIRFCSFHFL